MPLADRIRVLIVVVAVPLAFFAAWETRERPAQFVAILTDVPASVVTDAVEYLRGREIPYEVRDGGHDLWVPASLRAELKIELARLIRRSDASAGARDMSSALVQ